MSISVNKTLSFAKLRAMVGHSFRLAWTYKINFCARYLSSVVVILLYYFLGKLIQSPDRGVFDGGSYFTFALIGTAFFRYLMQISHAFSANLREQMLMGTIEPLMVTATPTTAAILGPSSWVVIEATLIVMGQFVLGALIGADFSQANWLLAVLVGVMSLASVISYGILSAAFTIVFKRGDPVVWFVNSVGFLFCGVFFPISVLPSWLQFVSYLLPVTYALRALRGALTGGASLADLTPDLGILLAFALVLTPLSIWALRRAIRLLKETGELVHY